MTLILDNQTQAVGWEKPKSDNEQNWPIRESFAFQQTQARLCDETKEASDISEV